MAQPQVHNVLLTIIYFNNLILGQTDGHITSILPPLIQANKFIYLL